MSLEHNYLNTITLYTDWDLPLVNRLIDNALFYCENGFWDGLQETTLAMLEGVGRGDKVRHRPLKQAFNNWIEAKQKLDFDEDSTEVHEAFAKTEQALADELLDYHADRQAFIIVHAIGVDDYDEAWFLCFYEDVADLDKSIKA